MSSGWLIWKVSTLSVTVLLPIIMLIRDWKFRDKRTKKHHTITRWVLVAMVTTGISTTTLSFIESRTQIEVGTRLQSDVKTQIAWTKGSTNFPRLFATAEDAKKGLFSINVRNDGLVPWHNLEVTTIPLNNMMQSVSREAEWNMVLDPSPALWSVDGKTLQYQQAHNFGSVSPEAFRKLFYMQFNPNPQASRASHANNLTFIITTYNVSGLQSMAWNLTTNGWAYKTSEIFGSP